MYEIVVPSIKITHFQEYGDDPKTIVEALPARVSMTGWIDLRRAMKDHGIEDAPYQYDDICCEELRLFLGISHDDVGFAERMRRCYDDHRRTEIHAFCPFCGTEIKFVWKIVGTFEASVGERVEKVRTFEWKEG